jgi:hypothetical protein
VGGPVAKVGSVTTYPGCSGLLLDHGGEAGMSIQVARDPYAPKSNRATGSAYRLVWPIDWRTSLVVRRGDPSEVGLEHTYRVSQGPQGDVLVQRGVKLRSHLRTYRRDPTREGSPMWLSFLTLAPVRG